MNKKPSMNQIRQSARKSTSKIKIDEITNLLESDTQNNTCDEEQYHPFFMNCLRVKSIIYIFLIQTKTKHRH